MGDWLAMAVTSVVFGVGSAMAWFKASNKKRDLALEELEDRMQKYEEVRAAQATQLAVLQTCQANIDEKLEGIKEEIGRTAQAGAHSVNTQMANVLNEVQKLVALQHRRT